MRLGQANAAAEAAPPSAQTKGGQKTPFTSTSHPLPNYPSATERRSLGSTPIASAAKASEPCALNKKSPEGARGTLYWGKFPCVVYPDSEAR